MGAKDERYHLDHRRGRIAAGPVQQIHKPRTAAGVWGCIDCVRRIGLCRYFIRRSDGDFDFSVLSRRGRTHT